VPAIWLHHIDSTAYPHFSVLSDQRVSKFSVSCYSTSEAVRHGKINGADRNSNSGPFVLSPQACHSGCATHCSAYRSSSTALFLTVQVQPVDDADSTFLHPLHMSRLISQISPRNIVEIRKTGRSRVIAEMRNLDSANRLISNEQLSVHKLKVFIPLHRVLRIAIIRDVPQNFILEMLRESTSSVIKILEMHRLNRRVKIEGELRYLPSRTICVKFAGQFLPPHFFIFGCKYAVSPFIPKTRICFSCFRVGHMSKACKNQPWCIYCGKNRHKENEECTLKSSPPVCINYKGAHLPTSHECTLVIKHKMILSLASTENLSIADARKRVSDSSFNSLSPFSVQSMISVVSLTFHSGSKLFSLF